MAIVSRAARDITLSVAQPLPEGIGPGTYDAKDPATWKVRNSHAPFSSTSERMTHEAKDINTPGPGTYGLELSPARPKKAKPSSTFASRTSRMLSDTDLTKRSTMPGPGSYATETNAWLKATSANPAVPTSTTPSGKAINWIKVSTAPSIPAPSQSYGYEEGPKGELIQQKPPNVGFSGRGDLETAGPGYYEAESSVLHPRPKLAPFGASKVPRMGVPLSKEVLLRPGPGSYEVTGKAAEEPEEVKPSAVFLSSTTRDKLSFSHKRETPGPGAYNVAPRWRAADEHTFGVAEHLHAFGSTCKKLHQASTEQHPVPVHNPDVPGPGAYDDGRKPLAATTVADKDQMHGAFNSTAHRFAGEKTTEKLTPGPGYYSSEQASLTKALQKKLVGRYGVFGTTSQRFPVPKTESQVGPGAYDPKPETKLAEIRKKDVRSAVFSSASDRTLSTVKKIDDVPPVGAYATEHKPWGKKSASTAASALDRAPRFPSPAKRVQDTPGPGYYETARHKTVEQDVYGPDPVLISGQLRRVNQSGLDRSGHAKSQGSQQARWRVNNDREKLPGPGAYDVGGSMVKRTFNITIGESWS